MLVGLRGVTVELGGRRILDGIDLQVHAGESLAVTGPSGSGKSTLLAVLAGLRTADHGTRTAAPGLSVAWVFQTSPILARRTAADNVALGARSAGAAPAGSRRRAQAALEALGVGHLADRPLHRLSGGERQRVAIARAMAARAPLLLADEPSAALDAASTGLVTDALAAAAGRGVAVVIATHDPLVAERADRGLRLRGGRLLTEAP